MGWYYDYKPPIRTDEGIKAKSTRGDFVKSWWATRWIEAMERVMHSGRLQRGKRYARQGQVLSLDVGEGRVAARVQGTRPTPYKVSLDLEPLTDEEWERVIEALAEQPYFVAQLLAGEMPPEIEDVFEEVGLHLFPTRRELLQSCSCPDSAAVCKHLAAAHYILGERLDEDPFLLFKLRGRDRDAIMPALGSVAGPLDEPGAPAYAPAPPLPAAADAFWQPGPELQTIPFHIEEPDADYPLLERLGAPDFLPEVRPRFVRTYDGVQERALSLAYPPEPEDEAVEENEE